MEMRMTSKGKILLSIAFLGLFSCGKRLVDPTRGEQLHKADFFQKDCIFFDGYHEGMVFRGDTASSNGEKESNTTILLKFTTPVSLHKDFDKISFHQWNFALNSNWEKAKGEGSEGKAGDEIQSLEDTFYKWKKGNEGGVVINETPLPFQLRNVNTQELVEIENKSEDFKAIRELNFEQIKPYLQFYSSPTEFFSDHYLAIKTMNDDFSGIVISTKGNGITHQNITTLTPPIPLPGEIVESSGKCNF